ncbi:DUF7551 domain-containing protein [Halostella salina]|uniref:DUF7551 domain-containing protein n=1 Tax=Halostella salina TaxID=1547897 RepID=UPI000EF84687|nr:hypothetical protein [Halostella salina]
MVGMTLVDIRDHIESLASEDGEYYVLCGRTGERPVPAAGERFADRATARSAARATEQYRTALRRYDPQLPFYDLIVCQDTGPLTDVAGSRRDRNSDGGTPLDRADGRSAGTARRRLVEFSHRVAGAVFETLSDAGHDAVERAVMDAYFDLAETTPDSDDLCLCLLESMATELDRRLPPSEQAELLSAAAARLPSPESRERPVSAVLASLAECGLLDGHGQSTATADSGDGLGPVVLWLSEYALSPQDGRLPVLPIVLELRRHRPDRDPVSVRAAAVDDGWQLTLRRAGESESDGFASAPIGSVE